MPRINTPALVGLLIAALVIIAIVRHTVSAPESHPPIPGTPTTTTTTVDHPARQNQPSAQSNEQPLDTAPGSAEPASTPPGPPDEGTDQPAPPSAGAPPAAEVAEAETTAARYVQNLLTYGYPDRSGSDFLTRTAPYMTNELASNWRTAAAHTTDDPEWNRLISQQLRHVTEVDDTVVTSWGGRTKLAITVVFRSGDITADRSLSGAETRREAVVVMVKTVDGWRAANHRMVETGSG